MASFESLIQIQKYKARSPKRSIDEILKTKDFKKEFFGKTIGKLQDIEINIEHKYDSLIRILRDELVESNFGRTELEIRKNKAKNPLSALLFGPPGTSKTQVTKAVAEELGWPMVEINPSEFVKGSFANVYLQAEEIFIDLMDLSAVVILFDEMDALTQKRGPATGSAGSNHLDIRGHLHFWRGHQFEANRPNHTRAERVQNLVGGNNLNLTGVLLKCSFHS